MKKTYLLALPLAGILAVPSVAQQNMPQNPPSNSQTQLSQTAPAPQPASQSVNDPQTTASANASGKEPLKVETREGFWGKLNPLARKKYVQRQLAPVRDRVNELDELTAQNGRMIKDVDARATEGIRVATLKANEADQHAVDAGNRATLAHQTAAQASTRLNTVETVVSNIDQYQSANEIEIRFRPGQGVLSKRAKEALDDVAESMKDQKGYIVEVQGFSSGSGAAALANSQKMAQAVVRYLVINHEVPVYRVYTVGMGNAKVQDADGNLVRTRGGRVEIHLLRNGIADLQQSASMSTQPMSTQPMSSQPMSQPMSQPPASTTVSQEPK